MTITTKEVRNGDELEVDFTASFVIPYEGSLRWMGELKKFIDKYAI